MKNKTNREEMLAKLFGSTSRVRTLVFMFSHVPRTFYHREIMYETGLSLQAVQRELNNLVELEIPMKRETNARVYFQINTDSPFFKPLLKISGLVVED